MIDFTALNSEAVTTASIRVDYPLACPKPKSGGRMRKRTLTCRGARGNAAPHTGHEGPCGNAVLVTCAASPLPQP